MPRQAKQVFIHAEKSPWISVRRSSIHHRGVFAKKRIPEETMVVQYAGERVTKAESDRRGWELLEKSKETGEAGVYLFELNSRYDIDGNVPWNVARLINHSCDPNCEVQIVGGEIWVIALREIPRGEEILFNYGFDLENFEDHPCRCGSERCVGYICGEDYWPALRRKLRKREKELREAIEEASAGDRRKKDKDGAKGKDKRKDKSKPKGKKKDKPADGKGKGRKKDKVGRGKSREKAAA